MNGSAIRVRVDDTDAGLVARAREDLDSTTIHPGHLAGARKKTAMCWRIRSKKWLGVNAHRHAVVVAHAAPLVSSPAPSTDVNKPVSELAARTDVVDARTIQPIGLAEVLLRAAS